MTSVGRPAGRRVVVRAPAKLTVSLRITGVRDDGYHLLDAEMVTLELADTLTFADGDALTVGGRFAPGVPTDDSNLIRRALRAIDRRAAVHVDKAIPPGGGLGGGSADAAAVLRWAGVDDPSVGASLGADVTFCLVGGRARVTGVGEQLEPLPFVDRTFTLVTPAISVSTPAAYRAWDALVGARGAGGKAGRAGGGTAGPGGNDLEPAALVVAPELATWRDRIREVTGHAPQLAGSGATWFVDGAHPDLARALPDAAVVVTRTDRP